MSTKAKIIEDFKKFLDKATDPMLLEPDEIAVAEDCRMIDDFIVEPEDAIEAIHGKIRDDNPHTVYYALMVLNSIFYKCGNIAHTVIVTREYMELIKDIIQTTEHKKIEEKIISMLEDWADKFKCLPNYCAVQVLLEELHGSRTKKKCNLSPTCQKSVANKERIEVNNDCIESDLNIRIDVDVELDENDEEFERHLKARKDKEKQEYKLQRKEFKLSTSFDEENKHYDNYSLEVRQRMTSSGINCEGNNNKNKQEERLITKGMRKVKEMKELLERSLVEYRVKKQEYNKNHSNNCLDSAADGENENIPIKSQIETTGNRSQRELEIALLLSQMQSGFFVDVCDESFNINLSEENKLGEPSDLYNSQAKNSANDETNLQTAINLSILEAKKQNLSSMPMLDENVDDLHLCIAKQLSLDDVVSSRTSFRMLWK